MYYFQMKNKVVNVIKVLKIIPPKKSTNGDGKKMFCS